MSRPVNHLFSRFTITISLPLLNLAGCTEDPCVEQPDLIYCGSADGADDAETGNEPGDNRCAPFLEPDTIGTSYLCHGSGNGWLSLDIYGGGVQPPECVNWGDGGKPSDPSSDDCVPVPLEMLPGGVPNPAACCTAEAMPEDIASACMDDCGYAACELAIVKLRTAAEALPNPDSPPLKQQAEMVVRADLFAYANLLEAPDNLVYCADAVEFANGDLATINLGEGMSSPSALGHVKSATLSLQCNLDGLAPYSDDGLACESPPNHPLIDQEWFRDGLAGGGTVTLFTADGPEQASIGDVAFSLRETTTSDGTTSLSLVEFEAQIADASHDGLHFSAPRLRLLSPAAALALEQGDSLRFPTAALRFEASAVLSADGVPLFSGERVTLEVSNSGPARALRSGDGFAFVELPFEVGGYPLVVNTQMP